MTQLPDHKPYYSLESFRERLVDKYLNTYTSDIVVTEKIHGSNICIQGVKTIGEADTNCTPWSWLLGSRRKWIDAETKFNNMQKIFAKYTSQIETLFNDVLVLVKDRHNIDSRTVTVRMYGEIFGGKYGGSKAVNSMRTQSEPNYGPDNDMAFFDIFIDDFKLPITETFSLLQKHKLFTPPIIFQGKLVNFLADFQIEEFKSIVSKQFYNLDYIDTPKSTEGVVIQTINPSAEGDETIVLKYKQSWILENRRVNQSYNSKPEDDTQQIIQACIDMLNENRLISYKSKTTIDDLINPKLIVSHVKEIIEDTMKDIYIEFPRETYPLLDFDFIKKKLSKMIFPMFKKFVSNISDENIEPTSRINMIESNQNFIKAELNMIKHRIQRLNKMIK